MARMMSPVLALALAASACEGSDVTELSVAWQPIDHSVGSWKFFRSQIEIQNHGPAALQNHGWKLYFSFARRILKEGEGDDSIVQNLAAQGVQISQAGQAASGDYYVLEPLASF